MEYRGLPVKTLRDLSATHWTAIFYDIGQKRDWTTGIALSCARERPREGVWMPMITGIVKKKADMSAGSPATQLDVLEAACEDLSDNFDFGWMGADATRDPTATDWLGRRYGRSRVEGIIFSPKMQMQMWHDTLYYVNNISQAFRWARTRPGTRTHGYIAELKEQLITEEARLNDRNTYDFRHPGPHNDLLHAFNGACHGMRKWQNSHGKAHKAFPMRTARPVWRMRGMARPYGEAGW